MGFMIHSTLMIPTARRYCHLPPYENDEFTPVFESLIPILDQCVQFKVTYRIFGLTDQDGSICIESEGLKLPGAMARRMLSDCHHVIVLGASLGGGFDRKLKELELTDPAKALFFDALGSALIDDLCDEWTESLKEKLTDLYLTDRFSCGYGDLPLTLQQDLADLLDLQKTCGIHVLDSSMMTPSKSITALIGLSDTPQPARIRGCAFCSMNRTCPYRKGGTTCHV